MWNPVVIIVLCLCSLTYAVPLGLKKNMAIVQEEEPVMMMATDEETRPEMMISRLNLPSNATSIRADITDGFSCDNKTYGYYADVENECQIFHVCLPVTYADGKENTFRWSFICPEETVFSQDSFTCMRPEDMSIDCEESFKYYELNRNFGMIESEDTPSQVVDEEMNMEELSRQPDGQEFEQEKKPVAVAAPVRREPIKVQSSNRRKTQANRATLESQRRKVQPLRKIPQTVEPAPTTAKPVEEDAPVFEQEAERTTVKYNRFTKRPTSIVKEQPKPEPNKPEQQLLRQDLFSQKRKRPQIFTAAKVEASVETEEEAPKKPVTVEPEIISHDQAEAQASEIAEVSIKPRDEEIRVEAMPMEVVKMESLKKTEPVFVNIPVQEEIAPMPANTPSRVEIVEIPIQKIDEPVVVEAPAPIIEEPMPMANVILSEPAINDEVEKLINEELLAEQTMQSELTKSFEEEQAEPEQVREAEKAAEIPAEAEMPEEVENDALEAIPEIEQMLEAVKAVEHSVEQPIEEVQASEPEKILPTIAEAEMPAAESVMDSETVVESEVPAVAPLKTFETMVEPEVQSSETSNVVETMVEPEIAAAVHEIAETLKSTEPEVQVKIEAEPESDKTNEAEMVISEADAEPEALVGAEKSVAEPEIEVKVETPVAESEKPFEVEVPALAPESPLKVESAVPELPNMVEDPVPEVPLVVELPMPEMQMQIEAEPEPESAKPLETEIPTVNMEMTKTAEISPVLVETPMELVEKPLEIEVPAEPVIVLNAEPQIPVEADPIVSISGESQFPIESEQSEVQLEKSNEVQSEAEAPQSPEQMEAGPQAIAEEETQSSAAEPEIDTQTLILDFISSLVNSENSNLGEQAKPVDEIPSESIPETVAIKAEEQPAQIQEEPAQPMYIPITQGNDQSYQIPVQVIETPEPEAPMPVPVAAEPKLPLTVDDVVELVKESLDTPAEKENLIQEPLADQAEPEAEPQSDSEEIKPIYQRYFELGSNLLKSEALTASDEDEPTVVAAANDDSKAEEPMPASEQLASEPEPALNSVPQTDALPVEALSSDVAPGTDDRLTMSRSMNRFRMDPRKRRFLFRSDAS